MKFKIKMDKKDAIAVGIFAVILFYLCCIILLNFISLTKQQGFHGLNPFPALTLDLLPGVIVLFVGLFLIAFTSVEKTVFKMEKGFGFEVGDTSEKRWSKWETQKEMQKSLVHVKASDKTMPVGGIPIITDGDNMYLDSGEYHSIVIGSTGAGKTRRFIQPMLNTLIKGGESIIVTDPKGELYRNNSGILKAMGYKTVVLNFREPLRGNSWNPLALPYYYYKKGNIDKAIELVTDVAYNILHEEKTTDIFWSHAASDYFVGLALALFEDAPEEEVNINSISLMSILGEERAPAGSYLKEYFKDKDPTSAAYINVTGTMNAPNETQGSILSTFRQKMKVYLNTEVLSKMLAKSDFEMADIGRQKTAVFMIIHDEKTTYHPLATTFIQQCYEALIDAAQQEPKGELPIKTNFVLDEFANMPPLRSIATMVTAARSRRIRFHLVIQSYSQLNDVYGKDKAETIKTNCNINIYLLTSELSSLEEISRLCGEVKGKDDKEPPQPLVSINELQRLKMGTVIITTIRKNPFKTEWPDLSQYNFGPNYPEVPLPNLVTGENRTFNLKEYVDAKRKRDFQNKIGDGVKGNPFKPNPMVDAKQANKPLPGSFDVDSLLKKIDAKIAELEEEEKQETKKIMGKVVNQSSSKEPLVEEKVVTPKVVIEPDKEISTKPIIKVKEEPQISEKKQTTTYSDHITDDQFFDDFFAD